MTRFLLARFLLITVVAFSLAAPSIAQNGDDDTQQETSSSKSTADYSSGESEDKSSGTKRSTEDAVLESVLGKVRSSTDAAKADLKEREAKYEKLLARSRKQLDDAKAKLARLEANGTALENTFDSNEKELDRKSQLLKDKIGALKELFGVFQQTASDLIGAFNGSPTSIQYPDRDKWLEAFANRMKNASEVSSVDDIKGLWFEMQREITAAGEIVRLQAPVVGPQGETNPRSFVRIGNFNLVTDEPDPSYLVWQPSGQQITELKRQPTGGGYLEAIDSYMGGDQGLYSLGIDPTGGVLLSLLVEKPTLRERIDQGGLVGYLILSLGAVALIIAAFKLLEILIVVTRVNSQRRNLDNPKSGNALGRVLGVYNDNRHVDSETLEMRLHEQVSKESTRVNRFIVFLGIIAAVAPLMGLLGTVVGMINTFQAITLYGTGDPQTMAGGISQALITTVLGLVVAVPTVLLHAIVKGRAKSVVNILQQESAGLTADQMQSGSSGHHYDDGDRGDPAPSPA